MHRFSYTPTHRFTHGPRIHPDFQEPLDHDPQPSNPRDPGNSLPLEIPRDAGSNPRLPPLPQGHGQSLLSRPPSPSGSSAHGESEPAAGGEGQDSSGHLGSNKHGNEDLITGTTDLPLTTKGRHEAERLGRQAKDATQIRSGPMTRTRETGEIVGQHAKLSPQVDPSLQPWHLGQLQGKPQSEVTNTLNDYIANHPDRPIPGGESFNDYKDRLIKGVQHNLIHSSPTDQSLNITHSIGVHTIHAWVAKGMPLNRSIDTATMLDREKIDPNSLWHLDPEAAKLDSAKKIDRPGQYFARHAETAWDNVKAPSPSKESKHEENSMGLSLQEQSKHLADLKGIMKSPGFARMPSESRVMIQNARFKLEGKLPKEMKV